MSDYRSTLERELERLSPPRVPIDQLLRRRDRKHRNQRIRAGVLGLAVAIAVGWWGIDAIRSTPVPADDRSEELGIFAPVAGRIAYVNDGIDRGYDPGLWAVDPSGPSDTTEGPSVADDAVSTLVPLGLEDAMPLGWSGDGTELLFARTVETDPPGCDICANTILSVLHADGSETRLNRHPMDFGGATISLDGSRVAFSADGLYVVDADGGEPVRIAEEGGSPTFSPDGRQIAYLGARDDAAGNPIEATVWVADTDGSDAHEILADEPTLLGGVSGLHWSPAADRLALGVGGHKGADALAIYTFAPDGSDFTRVLTGGESPYWSPDGSQIAYTILCDEHPHYPCPEGSILRSQYDAHPKLFGGGAAGLAIADADGSNVREFGFAASGPWHPSESVQADETTPTLDDSFARADGEVLSFTGGDLVAVNPETGEERVLVEEPGTPVHTARWSADGRWVAYETDGEGAEWDLWVVGASQEPRLIATGGQPYLMADFGLEWIWSPAGAHLAITTDSTLRRTIDLTTGETTDLGIVADHGGPNVNPMWAGSPDGTRIAFQMPGWALSTVDVRSGERSLLARLPGEDFEWIDQILWSPDGSHITVRTESESGAGRLDVMDADGSNVRVLADDSDPLVVDWSPDGARLAFAGRSGQDGEIRIWAAPMDGAAPVEIGSVSFGGCTYNYTCGLTWSPDGSQIAFHKDEGGEITVFDADGAGEAQPIDELTYASWDGGSYSCQCP